MIKYCKKDAPCDPECPGRNFLHIEAAAIILDGRIYQLPPPARHHDIMHKMTADGIEPHLGEQGFVDSKGTFRGRIPALVIARKAGQVLRETAPQHGLFSEDLW